MNELHELKEKLISELEDYSKKGKFSKDDIETIKYLASSVDHLCNVVDGMDDGYSGYDMTDNRINRSYGRYGGSYGMNRSYRNQTRDSMGRYSRHGDVEGFMMELGRMMGSFPEDAKRDAEKLMRKLEETM